MQGDMVALRTVDLRTLRPDEVEACLGRCREVMTVMEDEVENRIHQDYGYDFPYIYSLLSLFYPQLADWDYLTRFLANPMVTDSRKREACKALAACQDRIEPRPRLQLKRSLEQLLQGERQRAAEPLLILWQKESGGAALEELFLEIADPATEVWAKALAEMIGGDSNARCDAADFMSRHSGYETSLLILLKDSDKDVAAYAAKGIARKVNEDPDLPTAYRAALLKALKDQDEKTTRSVLAGLFASGTVSAQARPLLEALTEHPSKLIREASQQALRAQNAQQ